MALLRHGIDIQIGRLLKDILNESYDMIKVINSTIKRSQCPVSAPKIRKNDWPV